jgi:hypothetical protein
VIVISYDEIAVYWIELRHFSSYKRVDLVDALHPDNFGTDILDEEETSMQDLVY